MKDFRLLLIFGCIGSSVIIFPLDQLSHGDSSLFVFHVLFRISEKDYECGLFLKTRISSITLKLPVVGEISLVLLLEVVSVKNVTGSSIH